MKSWYRARHQAAHFSIVVLLATLTSVPLPAQAPETTNGLSTAERVYGLSLIWKEAAYNFPYFDGVPDLDWDAAYREFVPRVLQSGSTLAYYRELQRFMALLHDGHSVVHLPDSIVSRRPFSGPWVDLKSIAGRPMVANASRAIADSLPIGSEIIEVDGLAVDDRIERSVLPWVFAAAPHSRRISAIEGSFTRGYGLLVGEPDTDVSIVAVTPDGSRVRLTLRRDRFNAQNEWVLPTQPATGASLELDWIQPRIAHLALNSFADGQLAARLDSILPELRTATGVIIDLRRNGGGSDFVGQAVLARFTDQPLVGTTSKIRVNDAYYRALGSFGRETLERALPSGSEELVDRAIRNHDGDAWRIEPADTARPVFDGERIAARVAVLIGRHTGSAAENFVVNIVNIPDDTRFVTIGSPTAGSTGQPLVFQLPGGGSGQVVTRGVLLPDGTPLVRTGIVPDIAVEPTIEQVRRDEDPVLDEAVRILTGGR